MRGGWSRPTWLPRGPASAIVSTATSCARFAGGEGRYLLRTNLTEEDPAKLWDYYLQLVTVEEAFKALKGDLAIRPIFHQRKARVEAHIFIAFLNYCLQMTLARRLHGLAPGLTPAASWRSSRPCR